MEERQIRVGLGAMIFKEGKILLGKRKGSHGEGDYSLPGGHMEWGESYVECIRRETREEAGLEIENVRFALLGNIKKFLPRHYVQIGFVADWKSGEHQVLEPEKCESWQWYGLDKLPSPLFYPSELLINAYKKDPNIIHFIDA